MTGYKKKILSYRKTKRHRLSRANIIYNIVIHLTKTRKKSSKNLLQNFSETAKEDEKVEQTTIYPRRNIIYMFDEIPIKIYMGF